jgi:ribosome modulation factor
VNRRYIAAEDLPYGPGNEDYEYDGARQRELDDAEAKRNASGTSAEILSLQQALLEGQRAGYAGRESSENPYSDPNCAEFHEWLRGWRAARALRTAA